MAIIPFRRPRQQLPIRGSIIGLFWSMPPIWQRRRVAELRASGLPQALVGRLTKSEQR